jgi:hypothetical protein
MKNRTSLQVTDNNGNLLENQNFYDFDALADHMESIAEKWYSGLVNPNTNLELKQFDEKGNVTFKDSVSLKR